ncbi:MAG: DUF4984 domain-containing protein [Bacteroidales bacterium]
MKKNIFFTLALGIILSTAFSSCSKEEVMYSGQDYVMFADSMDYMPVRPIEDSLFDVEVSATNVASYDRHYAVELVVNKTNAIEGYHFDFVTRNLTIKAGELSGAIQLKGHFENIVYGEKLEIALRLLAPKTEQWELYGNEAKVSLIKCPDFNIQEFAGNLEMIAAFPFSDKYISFYVESEIQDDSTLIIREPFDNAYDLKVRFHSNNINPFENGISVLEQVAFPDASYGQVYVKDVSSNPSYYLGEGRVFALFLDVFVPRVGSFGVHQYLFRWVPQSQVDADNNNTGTPMMMNQYNFVPKH